MIKNISQEYKNWVLYNKKMRQKRSRKFIYEIITSSNVFEKWMETLREINAKYHIFHLSPSENESKQIKGFIYFVDTKTISSITSITKPEGIWKIQMATDYPIHYANLYKQEEPFYEFGEIPRQGIRTKETKHTSEIVEKDSKKWEDIYEMLLKQNQMLLEENQKWKETKPAVYNTMNIVENKTINIQLFLKEIRK
jgi:hypothetical protein